MPSARAPRAAAPWRREPRGLDPAPLPLRAYPAGNTLGDLLASRRLVVSLEEAAAPSDHLTEGPEGDPLTVGRRAPAVPPGVLDETVGVLGELPGEAALPAPGGTHGRHGSRPPVPPGRMEEVLEEPELVVATDERVLQALCPVAPPDLRHHAQGPDGRHGR